MSDSLVNVLPFAHLDENSFRLATYELSYGPVNYNIDLFETLLFNPLSINQCFAFNDENNLDPDRNILFKSAPSKYFIEDEVNSLFSGQSKNNIDFSLMHINARSLYAHLDSLKSLLTRLTKQFSIIGISETWLNDNYDLVNIQGYSYISNHRKDKTGGGVGIYLQDTLDYKILPKSTLSNSEVIESLFIEISVPQGKNTIVGVIYRPPNNRTSDFLELLSSIVSHATKGNKHCYIMGDFNLDLFHYSEHMPTQEFLDCLFSFSLFPLISKPTRLTSHSATLIDNIFRNSVSSHKNGLIINDLSDHLPIFSVNFDLNLPKTNTNLTFTRNFSDKNISKFRDLLSNVKWTDINSHSDPNKAYNDFFNRYPNLYNSCFPLRPVKGQASRFLKTPWITPALLKSIRKKNLMYKKLVANYDSTRETKYKSYKNKLTHLIRISKKKYYEAKFEMAKNDVKATWKLMNELINTKKRKHSLPSSFLLNEKSIDDPVVIANSFCNYFHNIGPSLARTIPKLINLIRISCLHSTSSVSWYSQLPLKNLKTFVSLLSPLRLLVMTIYRLLLNVVLISSLNP